MARTGLIVAVLLLAVSWKVHSFTNPTRPITLPNLQSQGSFSIARRQNDARITSPSASQRRHSNVGPLASSSSPPDSNDSESSSTSWPTVASLGIVSFLYWYWMVLAAAAVANHWPVPVPDFIPLVPGWPPSDTDLQPVIEDSFHFFYLSELLQNPDAPSVNPLRLAAFNIDEAWIFAYLIPLWKDPKRLPRPALLGLWALLGINLTNAFLAPYLLATELFLSNNDNSQPEGDAVAPGKNPIVSIIFGAVATAVISYAIGQSFFVADAASWEEFQSLIVSDRTYLAFCVDLPLFAFFQPVILSRVKQHLEGIDYVPIVGLLNWIFFSKDDD